MMINGVCGNDNLKVRDKGISKVPEEVENTAADNNMTSETMSAVVETGLITYGEEEIQI